MNEKLPAPCEGCSGSGLRNGAVCSECLGKGYRFIVNGRQSPVQQQRPKSTATPAPNAEPSAFPLSVWPLPAALVDRGQLAPFSFYSSTLRQAQPVSQIIAESSKGIIRIIGSPLEPLNA